MSKVVVAEFVSLEGVMEAPDQWQLKNDLFSEDMGKEMQTLSSPATAFCSGE